MGDLHRLGGVWSIWFLVILIATTFWYFSIRVGEPLLQFLMPFRMKRHRSCPTPISIGSAPHAENVLAGWARSGGARAFLDFRISYLRLDDTHGDTVTFGGNTGEVFGQSLSKVYVEPYSGRILGYRLSRDAYSFAWARRDGGGAEFRQFRRSYFQTIWSVFGAVITALSITGVIVSGSGQRAMRDHRSDERCAASGT